MKTPFQKRSTDRPHVSAPEGAASGHDGPPEGGPPQAPDFLALLLRQFAAASKEATTGPVHHILALAEMATHHFAEETARLAEENRQLAEENTRLKEENAILADRAEKDGLTGLLNRRGFMDYFAAAQERLQRNAATNPHDKKRKGDARINLLLMIDMDGLKQVNDTLGHAAGDACLVELGRRLRSHMRSYDRAARLGGDEFAVLFVDMPRRVAMRRAVTYLRQLTSEAPLEWQGHTLSIEASCGAALCKPDMQASIQDIMAATMECADRRLYANKAVRKLRQKDAQRPAAIRALPEKGDTFEA